MSFELYRWNKKHPKLVKPSLNEILESKQPFVITSSLRENQRIPDEIVMGNWFCDWFLVWQGVRIMDYSKDLTYLLDQFEYEEGSKVFKPQTGIQTEWSADKYYSGANWYELKNSNMDEVYKNFKELKFTFD